MVPGSSRLPFTHLTRPVVVLSTLLSPRRCCHYRRVVLGFGPVRDRFVPGWWVGWLGVVGGGFGRGARTVAGAEATATWCGRASWCCLWSLAPSTIVGGGQTPPPHPPPPPHPTYTWASSSGHTTNPESAIRSSTSSDVSTSPADTYLGERRGEGLCASDERLRERRRTAAGGRVL